MTTNFGSLDASIQEKLDGDTDFLKSIESLSDNEKEEKIDSRKQEIYEEHISGLKTDAEKAKELAENQKKRAERAESEAKRNGKVPTGDNGSGDNSIKKEPTISFKDSLALINAGVTHEEDVDEVVEYADFKKITVAEALKLDVLKTTLAKHAEFRKTQSVMNDGSKRNGSPAKVSDDQLLEDSKNGKIPEKGSAEADRLFWARRGGKR